MKTMDYYQFLKLSPELRNKFCGFLVEPGPVAKCYELGEEAKYKRALTLKKKKLQKMLKND